MISIKYNNDIWAAMDDNVITDIKLKGILDYIDSNFESIDIYD